MSKEHKISCKKAFCCLLPLGKLVGGEGSGVVGGQRDQVMEDPRTLVIIVMMMMMVMMIWYHLGLNLCTK